MSYPVKDLKVTFIKTGFPLLITVSTEALNVNSSLIFVGNPELMS